LVVRQGFFYSYDSDVGLSFLFFFFGQATMILSTQPVSSFFSAFGLMSDFLLATNFGESVFSLSSRDFFSALFVFLVKFECHGCFLGRA